MRDFLEGGYRAMRELRDSGAVGAIGLGVNEQAICEEALDHADFDVFLLAGRYTLLEQTALDRFLPRCAARSVVDHHRRTVQFRRLVEGAARRCTTTTRPRRPRSCRAGAGVWKSSAPPTPRSSGRRGAAVPAGPSRRCQRHSRHVQSVAGPPDVTPGQATLSPTPLGRPARAKACCIPTRLSPPCERRMSLILLHPDDNVLVLAEPIARRPRPEIDGAPLASPGRCRAVGHKLARRPGGRRQGVEVRRADRLDDGDPASPASTSTCTT
jgi:hypothetical protein